MNPPGPICAIAIPARNEAALIDRCLASIADQTVDPASLLVIILANNCTDATAAKAREAHWPMVMVVKEENFASDKAHAGMARRCAMEKAARHSPIILTTDADCVADRDWVAAMLASFEDGADAVAGRVSGDWEELRHHDPAALAIGALEWEYLALIGHAEALFDPRPHDPAPRHAQQCGANIGITRAMLATIGGVPALPCGEDRALMRAVDDVGGRLRHDIRPHVTASARSNGRAAGGMADALSRRTSPDYRCDEQFERAETLVARLQARSEARRAWSARPRGCPRGSRGGFAEYWSLAQAQLSFNLPPPLAPSELPDEIAKLTRLIAGARL